MRVLVTGGAGFIGSYVVKALVAAGEQVRILDNVSRGEIPIPKGIEVHIGDIRDADEILYSCRDINEVIHLAYINGTQNFYDKPAEVLDVGVRGMLNVLDACKANGVRRLMLVSSSEVCQTDLPFFPNKGMHEELPLTIPDPHNPRFSYSAGKIISEMLALHCGQFDWLTIVRPFNIYGPGMPEGHVIPDFTKRLQEGSKHGYADPVPFPIQSGGSETRSFCYIDDFVEGLMMVRAKGEHLGIYNIGNPEEVNIRSLAKLMANIYGVELFTTESAARPGSITRRRPDISKLAALGYVPKILLQEGLRRVLCQ
jgi:nucleoside-diphosphate-sugar epimerase